MKSQPQAPGSKTEPGAPSASVQIVSERTLFTRATRPQRDPKHNLSGYLRISCTSMGLRRTLLRLFAGNFPLWRPVGAMPGLWQASSEKAFRAGWQTRPFQETALDCLTCFRSRGHTLDWEDYLSPDKEKQVLDAWEHRSS